LKLLSLFNISDAPAPITGTARWVTMGLLAYESSLAEAAASVLQIETDTRWKSFSTGFSSSPGLALWPGTATALEAW
jgi:hypothetical protein